MTNYGHPPLFGVILTPDSDAPERTVDLAVQAEKDGLDLVSVADHPYHPAFMDSRTLLNWVAAVTKSVTVMPNVANLSLRPPAGLARSAATFDLLSRGSEASDP